MTAFPMNYLWKKVAFDALFDSTKYEESLELLLILRKILTAPQLHHSAHSWDRKVCFNAFHLPFPVQFTDKSCSRHYL